MTKPNYATFSYTIPAGGSVEGGRQATFMTCLAASDTFKVKINNGSDFEFEAGLGVTFEAPFTRWELVNETASDITVTLAVGQGNVRDARMVVSDLQATVSGTVDIGNEVTTAEKVATTYSGWPVWSGAAGFAGVLMTAIAGRVACGFKNIGTERVWIKHDSALTLEGHPLDPGETLVLDLNDELYCYNPSGVSVDVARWEYRR